MNAVDLRADGRRALSGSEDQTIGVWNLETRHGRRKLGGHSGRGNAVTVTAEGRRAVSRSSDHTLRVWGISAALNAGLERSLEKHTRKVNAMAVTPDGRRAVSGPSDHTLRVWDLETGREVACFIGDTGGDVYYLD